MKRWVIINIEELAPSGRYPLDAYFIEAERRPTLLYETREIAEKELVRLARSHRGEFVLLEAVARGTRVQTCAGVVGRLDPAEEVRPL